MAPSWVLLHPELLITHDAAVFSDASQESEGWMSEGRPPYHEETREAVTAYLHRLKPDAHVADPPEISSIRILRPTGSVPPLCDLVDSACISSADKNLVALYAGPYRPGSDIHVKKGGYLIYDARKNSLSTIPQIPFHHCQSAIGYQTVVVSCDGERTGEGAGYVLAELTRLERLNHGPKAELYLWQSSAPGWVRKVGLLPPEVCSPTTGFCANTCFSFGCFLCWVDLIEGMVVCDLRQVQEYNSDPEFRYIPLPKDCPTYDVWSPQYQTLQVEEFRSMACVGDMIKFVSMDDHVGHRPGNKLDLSVWTLSSDLSGWKKGKVYNVGNIWENETHLSLGMRKLAPSLPVLSMHEDNVVYLVFSDLRVVDDHLEGEGQYLVRVDMENNKVQFYSQGTNWIRSQLFACEFSTFPQGLLHDHPIVL